MQRVFENLGVVKHESSPPRRQEKTPSCVGIYRLRARSPCLDLLPSAGDLQEKAY